MNRLFALVYLLLGVLSVILPMIVCGKAKTKEGFIVFLIVLVFYAASMLNLVFWSYRRSDLIQKWSKVRPQIEFRLKETNST